MANPSEAAPLLTVVIPVRNVEGWVGQALQSVLAQTYRNLDVVVVDNGSIDRSRDVVGLIAAEDSRVRIVAAPGVSGGAARNIGVDRARGDLLAFCDADDLVPPDSYRVLVESLLRTHSDFAVGQFLKFSVDRTWNPVDDMPAYWISSTTTLSDSPTLILSRPCWNKVFNLDFWRREKLSFPDSARSNDIEPMVAAYTRAAAIDVVPRPVYLYRERMGGGSMTSAASSARSVIAYLREELRCAQLVSAMGDLAVAWHYRQLVCERDTYVHISRYLLASGEADGLDQVQIQTLLFELLGAVGALEAGGSIELAILSDVAAGRARRAWWRTLILEGHRTHPVGDLWEAIAEELSRDGSDEAIWRSLSGRIIEVLNLCPGSVDGSEWRSWMHACRSVVNVWGASAIAGVVDVPTLSNDDSEWEQAFRARARFSPTIARARRVGRELEVSLMAGADCEPVLVAPGPGARRVLRARRLSAAVPGMSDIVGSFRWRDLPINSPLIVAAAYQDGQVLRLVAADGARARLGGYDPFEDAFFIRVGGSISVERRRAWPLRFVFAALRRLAGVIGARAARGLQKFEVAQ